MASKRIIAVGVRTGKEIMFREMEADEASMLDIEWHAHPAGSGDYSTLCGIDSDDPSIGHHGTVAAKPGQKITCGQCKSLWTDMRELKLRASDFQ